MKQVAQIILGIVGFVLATPFIAWALMHYIAYVMKLLGE